MITMSGVRAHYYHHLKSEMTLYDKREVGATQNNRVMDQKQDRK